jgi:hypothetical protein
MSNRKLCRGSSPPSMVVLIGCGTAWSEASYRSKGLLPIEFCGRANCPCGCKNRNLSEERRLGLERLCLRCLTWSGDPDGWSFPIPLAVVVAETRAKAKAATLAQRQFGNRERKRLGKRAAAKDQRPG